MSTQGTVDPELDPNRGALATNVSWYRRNFTLPAAAKGGLVWLTLDGVYRNADLYLNGGLVKHHSEGYTSWHAYLHKVLGGTLPRTPTPTRTRTLNPTPIPTLT